MQKQCMLPGLIQSVWAMPVLVHPTPAVINPDTKRIKRLQTYSVRTRPTHSWKGLIQPWKGLIQPWNGLIQPWKGLIQPWKGLIQPMPSQADSVALRCLSNGHESFSLPIRVHHHEHRKTSCRDGLIVASFGTALKDSSLFTTAS